MIKREREEGKERVSDGDREREEYLRRGRQREKEGDLRRGRQIEREKEREIKGQMEKWKIELQVKTRDKD